MQALTKRMSEPGKFIQVVVGGRQIGKTTLVTPLIDKIKAVILFLFSTTRANFIA